MGIEDKIKNAENTMWPAEGIPKWKVKWIIFWSQLKARIKGEVLEDGNDD